MPNLHESTINRGFVVAGAGFAMLAVMMGAFAAHGLKQVLNTNALDLVDTAARYQMYHAIALVIVGIVSTIPQFSRPWLKLAAVAFILGIILFSGSLYILALSGIKWMGAITPIGGIAFISGWCSLIVAALKNPGQTTD